MAFYQRGEDGEQVTVSGGQTAAVLEYIAYPYALVVDVYEAAASLTPTGYAGGVRLDIDPRLVAGDVWLVRVKYGTPTAEKPGLDENSTPSTLPPPPPPADPETTPPIGEQPRPLPPLEGQLGAPPGDGSVDPPGGGAGGDGTGGGLPNPISREAALGPEWNFDTTGATEKIYASIRVVTSAMYGGGAAPNVGNAIGASKDGVEGVEVYVPKLSLSVTWRVRKVSGGYLDALARLTGKINTNAFLFWGPLQCLFTGASGKYGSPGGWSVTYGFLIAQAEMDIEIVAPDPGGDAAAKVGLVIPYKGPWSYLDVGFDEDITTGGTGKKKLLKVPDRAYVHQVYRDADFSAMGFQ
jgi:hypothetical protein